MVNTLDVQKKKEVFCKSRMSSKMATMTSRERFQAGKQAMSFSHKVKGSDDHDIK